MIRHRIWQFLYRKKYDVDINFSADRLQNYSNVNLKKFLFLCVNKMILISISLIYKNGKSNKYMGIAISYEKYTA